MKMSRTDMGLAPFTYFVVLVEEVDIFLKIAGSSFYKKKSKQPFQISSGVA